MLLNIVTMLGLPCCVYGSPDDILVPSWIRTRSAQNRFLSFSSGFLTDQLRVHSDAEEPAHLVAEQGEGSLESLQSCRQAEEAEEAEI